MLRRFRYWLLAQLHQLTNRLMNRCRQCGSSTDVICYDSRGLWAYFWRKTWCPDHCPDHDFAYQRDLREWACNICGEPAPLDFWAYNED